ncbi:MAG: metallophosphoesterase family protein [Planctomycetota bacterium]
MKARFLHTADWQLGLRRHFLDEEALPRYMQARIDALGTMGRLVEEQACEFVVVAGDVFESNQVDRRTVRRTLEELAALPVPVYLLPGNHDPLDAASLYRSEEFRQRQADHVHVLDTTEPVEVRPGVEVVGVPWTSKEPRGDQVAEVCARLAPAPGLRVCVAHGSVLPPASRIDREAVERALAAGRIHFLALGDRHSTTEIGPRIWYAGTPEPTSYRETEAGHALVVELTETECRVARHAVGRWRFIARTCELDARADVEALGTWLEGLPDKDRTILKLSFRGALGLDARGRLDALLGAFADLFAAIEERDRELTLLPDDLAGLGLTGFAKATMEKLAARDDATARDALALLFRLAGGAGS